MWRKWSKHANFGRHISNMLDQCIWAGITGRDAGVLAEYIVQAGPGDYVEIGTAFGASAILAALTKRVYQIPGEVYCIDSFGRQFHPEGTTSKKVMENAEIFGVADMIHLTVARSHPWPLEERPYVFGLVDGSHRGLTPAKDFINLSRRVTGYIAIDDIGFIDHPPIALLLDRIRRKGEWGIAKATDKVAILQRRRR